MKKRIVSWLLALVVLCTLCGGGGFAQEDGTVEEDADFTIAQGLIASLSESGYYDQQGETMTRGQFLCVMADLLRWQISGLYNGNYEDVSDGDYLSGCVATAYSIGYVAPSSEGFRPDDPITYLEAVKLAVCAAGYQRLAEESGGYPVGYLNVATSIDLTKNLTGDTQGELSYRDGSVLLYQMLTCDMMSLSQVGETITYETKKGRTLLSEIHSIYEVTGIVTATPLSGLTSPETIAASSSVDIDGEAYSTEIDCSGWLGWRVKAFYTTADGERNVISAVPYKTAQFFLEGDKVIDFPTGGTRLYYEEEDSGKQRTLNLDSRYNLIYNGVSFPGHGGTYFTGKDRAKYTFLDNDGDDAYEVVLMTDEVYMTISKVDDLSEAIVDKQGRSSAIDLTKADRLMEAVNSEGQSIKWYQLPENTVVAAAVSQDGSVVRLRQLSEGASGTVESVDYSENQIYMGEEVYKISDYCTKEFAQISIGGTYSLVLDGEWVAVIEQSGSAEVYGYLVDSAATDGIGAEYEVKILTQNGRLEILKLAEKVRLDGSNAIDAGSENIQSVIGQQQLIKYRLNGDGEITLIDTAEDASEDAFDVQVPAENSLRRFPAAEPRWMSQTNCFFPYACVSGAMFFVVPESDSKKDDDRQYAVTSVSELDLRNSSVYNNANNGIVELYDIGQDGNCPVVVYRKDDKMINNFDVVNTALIEKVSEYEEGKKKVYVLANNQYSSYVVAADAVITKNSGAQLESGDIIRFITDSSGEIVNIRVDYSTRDWAPGADTRFNQFNDSNYANYFGGRIYSSTNGYAYFSAARSPYDTVEFNWSNLVIMKQTDSILVYDCKDKTVRMGSGADLMQAASDHEGSFFVARVNQYRNSQLIVVYTNIPEEG